jgi:predicted secreted protein
MGLTMTKLLLTRTSLRSIASVLFICSCAITYAAENSSVTVSEDGSGSTIELSDGKTLIIRLPARFGTGFSWAVTKAQGAPVELTSSRVERDGADRPGAEEMQVFVFKPTRKGSGTIELGYRQPWLKDEPPQRNFVLDVDVKN